MASPLAHQKPAATLRAAVLFLFSATVGCSLTDTDPESGAGSGGSSGAGGQGGSSGSSGGAAGGQGGSSGSSGEGGAGAVTGSAVVAFQASFGECAGRCVFDIALGEKPWSDAGYEKVVYIERDWTDDTPLLENHGALTPSGQELGHGLAEDLVPSQLEEIYGCPDCADGGASKVTLLRDGALSAHTYEHGNAPEILLSVDTFVSDLWVALRTCTSTEHIDVDSDCTPSE